MKTILLSLVPPVNQDIRMTVDDWIPRDPGILILVGTLCLVTLGVFIWAAFFRKRPRRRHYEFHHHHPDRLANRIKEGWKAGKFLLHRHRRHRHRERRRNPTLAEAGGLPPVRTGERPPNST